MQQLDLQKVSLIPLLNNMKGHHTHKVVRTIYLNKVYLVDPESANIPLCPVFFSRMVHPAWQLACFVPQLIET